MVKVTINLSSVNNDEIRKTIKFLESFLTSNEIENESFKREYDVSAWNPRELPPHNHLCTNEKDKELGFNTTHLNEEISVKNYIKPTIRKGKNKTTVQPSLSKDINTELDKVETVNFETKITTDTTSEEVINRIMSLTTEGKLTPIQVTAITKGLGLTGLPDIHSNLDVIPIIMSEIDKLVKE